MFCTQCGSKNNDDLERCWQCQALLVRRRPTDPGRPRRTDPVGGEPWPPAPDPNPGRAGDYEPYPSQYAGQTAIRDGGTGAPGGAGPLAPASNRSILAMVLSILGFVGCGPVTAVPGLILGWLELRAIREGRAPLAGQGFAKVGFYLGAILTALMILFLLGWIFLVGLIGWSFIDGIAV